MTVVTPSFASVTKATNSSKPVETMATKTAWLVTGGTIALHAIMISAAVVMQWQRNKRSHDVEKNKTNTIYALGCVLCSLHSCT